MLGSITGESSRAETSPARDCARRAHVFCFREMPEIDVNEIISLIRKEDPRFKLTAAELEEQGIDDFQLDYALRTLRRASGGVIARR